MDEIKKLEREINALQSQLHKQNAEMNQAREKMINENKKALKECQSDLQRALLEHDKKAQAEYKRLLSNYQKSLNEDMHAELSKMDASYNELLQNVKKSEAALLQKNQELEQAIQQIRTDAGRKAKGNEKEAKQYLSSAISKFRAIEKKPHEKFMPERLSIFYNVIKDGQQLFKAGLYEAATAVAISAKSGLERLEFTIDDKSGEWDRQYELFVFRLNYLQRLIQQEVKDWCKYIEIPDTDPSERKSRLIEINFWSKGVFADIVAQIKGLKQIEKRVSEVGKTAYLKETKSVDIDGLKKSIATIKNLEDSFKKMSGSYKSRYSASCERAVWGDAIKEFMTDEINLLWHDELTGYRQAAPEAASRQDFRDFVKMQFPDEDILEDSREWLKVVFENSSGNFIYVYIIPVEAQGLTKNQVILHIDFDGTEQPQYSHDIYQNICEAINYTEEESALVNYASDLNALKYSSERMLQDTAVDIERIRKSK